ncbi:GNAT family N-acetyltransferase [Streptomyces sp. NBC_01591]|uniref:GNAT family N-acetyltransferase n=1 Tax=Streptomyces sp. NBC_01591 TaxID=2975888 RepID=UPI002DDBD50F|nr:GNAT family N-acetyltransferase [Streptomyces sp. NBC_01591]WSD69779.1 GNAT family N-acetyltransferase [Streptomyces sp. NBC_01591]
MEHVIRAVRADEWPLVKELRLAALRDPAAPVAFLETYEQGAARSDEFWQDRALGASGTGSGDARQFVAVAPDGRWDGGVTVLIERPDVEVRFGETVSVHQAHVVGVFVRPGARGAGLAEELFRAGTDWARSLAEPRIERVRLYVHEGNARAAAFYRRIGFVATGCSVPVPGDPSARELEYAVERVPSG